MNWENVEKFVLSKTALLTGAVILILCLSNTINNRDLTIRSERKEHLTDLSKKDSIIAARDSALFDCVDQQKITADNATKAAILDAERYRELYLRISQATTK